LAKQTQVDELYPLDNEAVLALIRKIADGDKSALATLYDATSRLLFGLAVRILGDGASAEETLLDVYTYVWKHSASYDPKHRPLEWLTTIARARAVARFHWSSPDKRRQEHSPNLGPKMTVAPQAQKLARASLESLAPAQREILEWAYYSGLSCGEIAAQTGKPLGAIKTHARQGLSKLGELLDREAH
jgi:RNA polymerase sigma-70 factor (ECF subfamily)